MKLVISVLAVVTCAFANDFASRVRNFSIEILYHTQEELGGHVLISPLGIWSLMTTIAVGAEGDSQSQLVRALRLPSYETFENAELSIVSGYQSLIATVMNIEDGSVELMSHNFLFAAEALDINPHFKKKLQTFYKSRIMNLNFGSTTEVAETANMVIKNTGVTTSDVFIPEDFAESTFIATNVMNFKGLWKTSFNDSATKVEPFYDENKNKIGEANMMYKKEAVRYSNIRTLQSYVLELPYGNNFKFCMLLILPYEKVKVTEAYKNLQNVSIQSIFNKLEHDGSKAVNIKLPRFKISTNIVMNKPLIKLGVFDIFDQNRANFKSIFKDNNVFISEVVHNANIEVTERGIASPVLANEFQDDVVSSFEANRPFIYFLMEKSTATIIFGGIYSKSEGF